MNEIKCSQKDCPEVFRTSEPITPNAKYTCRHHTGPDTKNNARFQDHQFDNGLKVAGTPEGTHHLRRNRTSTPVGYGHNE